MKIIGLMLTWNNLEFFRCAVRQAWKFCDELILVEGCHSRQYPTHSDDGTCTHINTLRTRPRLRIADFAPMGRYDWTQCHIRQEYPKMSRYYEPGNWVFHWDDDLFFFEEDLKRIKHAMQHSKGDALDFTNRLFLYNFKFNSFLGAGQRTGMVCYRITEGLVLSGVSNAKYSNGRYYSVTQLNDVIMFHYGCVKKPERMRARFELSAEKGTSHAMERFEIWKSIAWDKEEDILENGALREIMPKGELNIYGGPHPEVLDDHPWRHVDDVRKVK